MLKETATTQIYFTTDTHFNHDPKWEIPIWKMRGYNSAKEMTDGIIETINDCVLENDILFHLGDFCLNTPPNQFEELLSRINCQNIYMLWGNHPNPHYKNIYKPLVKELLKDEYTDISEVYPLRYRNLIFVGHYIEAVLNGQFVILSHYPGHIWNEMQHGAWLLCGHSHGGCQFSHTDTNDGKILDCGWDLHKKPLSFKEIQVIMSRKKFVQHDKHHIPSIAPSNSAVSSNIIGANFSAS